MLSQEQSVKETSIRNQRSWTTGLLLVKSGVMTSFKDVNIAMSHLPLQLLQKSHFINFTFLQLEDSQAALRLQSWFSVLSCWGGLAGPWAMIVPDKKKKNAAVNLETWCLLPRCQCLMSILKPMSQKLHSFGGDQITDRGEKTGIMFVVVRCEWF